MRPTCVACFRPTDDPKFHELETLDDGRLLRWCLDFGGEENAPDHRHLVAVDVTTQGLKDG